MRRAERRTGIIVLGGVIDASGPSPGVMLNEAAERLAVVPELARRYPNARILFSGGSGALIDDADAEASFAAGLLESFGIARDRIILEDRSRNTVENAVFSKAIVQPRPGERCLLVTSAYHMPRAIGVFRKAGFPVEPDPIDWRTRRAEDGLRPFATIVDGLRRTDTAVHEWVASQSIGSPGAARSYFRCHSKQAAKRDLGPKPCRPLLAGLSSASASPRLDTVFDAGRKACSASWTEKINARPRRNWPCLGFGRCPPSSYLRAETFLTPTICVFRVDAP
jgi:uncharacterized SAM-binding protein YcdF (DUF218 family)